MLAQRQVAKLCGMPFFLTLMSTVQEPEYWALPDTSYRQDLFLQGCLEEMATELQQIGATLPGITHLDDKTRFSKTTAWKI